MTEMLLLGDSSLSSILDLMKSHVITHRADKIISSNQTGTLALGWKI